MTDGRIRVLTSISCACLLKANDASRRRARPPIILMSGESPHQTWFGRWPAPAPTISTRVGVLCPGRHSTAASCRSLSPWSPTRAGNDPRNIDRRRRPPGRAILDVLLEAESRCPFGRGLGAETEACSARGRPAGRSCLSASHARAIRTSSHYNDVTVVSVRVISRRHRLQHFAQVYWQTLLSTWKWHLRHYNFPSVWPLVDLHQPVECDT